MDTTIDTLCYCICDIYECIWKCLKPSDASDDLAVIRDGLVSSATDDSVRNSLIYLNSFKSESVVNYEKLYSCIDKVVVWMFMLGVTNKRDVILARTTLCLCKQIVETENVSSRLSYVKDEMENVHSIIKAKNVQILKITAENLLQSERILDLTKDMPPGLEISEREIDRSYSPSSNSSSPAEDASDSSESISSKISIFFGACLKNIPDSIKKSVIGMRIAHYTPTKCDLGVILDINKGIVSIQSRDGTIQYLKESFRMIIIE